MVHQRTDARIFHRNKRCDLFQSCGNTPNTGRAGTSIKKPVTSAASAYAPECAPRRRNIDVHADAVAEQSYVRQPRDKLALRDLAISVCQVIRVKLRCGISD